MNAKYIIKKGLSLIYCILRDSAPTSEWEKLKKNGTVICGKHSYGVPEIHKFKGNESTHLIIGNFTSIADGVKIFLGGDHHAEWISTFPFRIRWNIPFKYLDGQPKSKGDIIIGSDVWIAHGVTILSGVKIENGAIITAGSLVVKNIPAYSIVGGVPAKVIKYRFPSDIIDKLLRIQWWNWDNEEIIPYIDLLCSDKVSEFVCKVSKRI